MPLPRSATPQWHKSTRSGGSGNCVEAADVVEVVLVRDTKQNGTGPELSFAPEVWSQFIDGAKDGEFNL